MYFVQNKDAAHETQQAQRLMPAGQNRQERLIHRTGAHVRQESTPPVIGDPRRAGRRSGRPGLILIMSRSAGI